jgi:hypothetical protein
MNDQKRASVLADPAGRKPYQKPAFEREGVFETMALTCTKVFQTTDCPNPPLHTS